jgi:hypothetical protein
VKRTSISVVFGVAVWVFCVGFAAPVSATTLTIGDADPYYFGLIVDGAPASLSNEAASINFMADLALSTSGNYDPAGPADETISRSANLLCGALCPDATATGAVKDSTDPSTSLDLNGGWTYLLAKYDGKNFGSVVWYVAGLDEVDIPSTGGGYGLSHYSLFNPVPDGPLEDPLEVTPEPTTMLLLGSGLVVVAARLRRRRNT